jgi:hypothetical protein
MKRIWWSFSVVSIVLIGTAFSYLWWRERSLEPLSERIDLSRAGSYEFVVHGFAASNYHPEFRLQLPFRTDLHNWFLDNGYAQLWSGTPPLVTIEIHERSGKRVFLNKSTLTGDGGWAVTGAINESEVELYSSTRFPADIFSAYRVTVDVVRGSPRAAGYAPTFEIATSKEYVLLGPVLLFLALCVGVVSAAVAIGLAHLVVVRRRRKQLHCAAA